MILVDTSVVVSAVERADQELRNRLRAMPERSLRSVVVLGELKSGAQAADNAHQRRQRERTVRYYRLISVTARDRASGEILSDLFAEITATASQERLKVGQNDRWILAEAAHGDAQVWTADAAMHQLAVATRGSDSSVLLPLG